MLQKTLLTLAAMVAFGPLMTGCASNQALRASLSDRDDLIRTLRAEKQGVQERIQLVTHERDDLQKLLSSRALEMGVPGPVEASFDPGEAMDTGPVVDSERLSQYDVSYDRVGNTSVFRIPSSATFASGSATLSPAGENALAAVRDQLGGFPDSSFYIEGHTDNEPIKRSRFSTNRDLSYARARAVHDFLVTQGDIQDDRFVVLAHGPHRPIDTNDTPEGRGNNRRVEIVVRKRE